jgi:hypothetical protein
LGHTSNSSSYYSTLQALHPSPIPTQGLPANPTEPNINAAPAGLTRLKQDDTFLMKLRKHHNNSTTTKYGDHQISTGDID